MSTLAFVRNPWRNNCVFWLIIIVYRSSVYTMLESNVEIRVEQLKFRLKCYVLETLNCNLDNWLSRTVKRDSFEMAGNVDIADKRNPQLFIRRGRGREYAESGKLWLTMSRQFWAKSWRAERSLLSSLVSSLSYIGPLTGSEGTFRRKLVMVLNESEETRRKQRLGARDNLRGTFQAWRCLGCYQDSTGFHESRYLSEMKTAW